MATHRTQQQRRPLSTDRAALSLAAAAAGDAAHSSVRVRGRRLPSNTHMRRKKAGGKRIESKKPRKEKKVPCRIVLQPSVNAIQLDYNFPLLYENTFDLIEVLWVLCALFSNLHSLPLLPLSPLECKLKIKQGQNFGHHKNACDPLHIPFVCVYKGEMRSRLQSCNGVLYIYQSTYRDAEYAHGIVYRSLWCSRSSLILRLFYGWRMEQHSAGSERHDVLRSKSAALYRGSILRAIK